MFNNTKKEIIIWSDGGVRGNGNDDSIGGWGALIIYKDKKREIYGGSTSVTNNQMELTSVIKALNELKTIHIPIKIYSDSAYVVNGMNKWVKGWIRNGWVKSNKKPVLNRELWQELYSLSKKQDSIEFIWIKGHNNNEGNERADFLANKGMDELIERSQ